MRRVLALGAASATTTLAANEDSRKLGNTGVAKVVELLTGMKGKAEADAQEEKKAFAAYESWATSTTAELEGAIEGGKSEIEAFKATKVAMGARASEMKAAIEENTAKLTELEAAKDDKETAKNKANKEFAKLKAEYETNISAVDKAIQILKAQKDIAFPQMSKSLLQVASQMTGRARELTTMLLQQAPGMKTYENSSGGVVDMIEGLKERFTEELYAAQKTHAEEIGNLMTVITNLSGQIKNEKAQMKRNQATMNKANAASAKAAEQQKEQEEVTATDEKSLSEVTTEFKLKTKQFGERKTLREEEIVAMQKAIDIMQGIEVSLVQKSKSSEQASFIQLSSSGKFIAPVSEEDGEERLARVSHILRDQPSKRLQLLAVAMSNQAGLDPKNAIGKILNMIRDMITKLEEEGAAEAGKNGQCMQMMTQNKADIDEATAEQEKSKVEMEKLTAEIGENTALIKKLNFEQAESKKMMAEATKVRAESKKAHEDAIAEAQAGADACGKAITVLEEFYGKAADAESLLQQKQPVDTSDKPATFDKPYQGQQGQATGIVGMIEAIQADFLGTVTQANMEESQEAKAFDELSDTTEIGDGERATELSMTKQELSGDKKKLKKAEGEYGTWSDSLAAAMEAKRVIEVDKGCIANAGKTPEQLYKERMEARDAEMQSLREALSILEAES